MRHRLAASLAYVFDELGEELSVDRRCTNALIEDIGSRPQSPQLFGAYYDLVLAVEREDIEAARAIASELVAPRERAVFRIAGIQDRPAVDADRLRRLFLEDSQIDAADPDEAMIAECRERMACALAMLDEGFPGMAQEIRGLLREIVLAAGPDDPNVMTFDGVSSYMLWGSVLLNACGQTTVLDTAQALAHESGHNLLFGFCADGPLIQNSDDELFQSPLRPDARPMDGVVHATYVIARMHQTLSRLLDAGILDADEQAAARKDLAAHVRNFEAGDRTISEGARLTAVGAEVMESARSYMAAAKSI